MLKNYEHHANYYETNQMGYVHHSNLVRWMEGARIDVMEQTGRGYRSMEEAGIISSALEISCQHRIVVHFDDHILIRVRMRTYNTIRIILLYEIRGKTTGEL